MADWFIGQRIVCVDGKRDPSRNKLERLPVEGAIYTIRAIVPRDDFGTMAFRLTEITNPVIKYRTKMCELSFFASRFRPVVIPEADIAQFEAILRGVEQRRLVVA